MKTWVLLAVLFTLTGCAEARPSPREYALRLETEGNLCGATTVGPNEIETAVHCLGAKLRLVNDTPVQIVSSRRIGDDRVRVTLSGISFKSWAKPGRAEQGDHVHWWGQPMGVPFVYREGVVVMVAAGGLVIDATICHGDSGSGLFNDAGELVGVVSAMSNGYGCTFMLAH